MLFDIHTHTQQAFEAACHQLELQAGATLFEILSNPQDYTTAQLDEAEYLDSWDCWLYTVGEEA